MYTELLRQIANFPKRLKFSIGCDLRSSFSDLRHSTNDMLRASSDLATTIELGHLLYRQEDHTLQGVISSPLNFFFRKDNKLCILKKLI